MEIAYLKTFVYTNRTCGKKNNKPWSYRGISQNTFKKGYPIHKSKSTPTDLKTIQQLKINQNQQK